MSNTVWKAEEVESLRRAVLSYREQNPVHDTDSESIKKYKQRKWSKICAEVGRGRNVKECKYTWRRVKLQKHLDVQHQLKHEAIEQRGALREKILCLRAARAVCGKIPQWAPEELAELFEAVNLHPRRKAIPKKERWMRIAAELGTGKTYKQCQKAFKMHEKQKSDISTLRSEAVALYDSLKQNLDDLRDAQRRVGIAEGKCAKERRLISSQRHLDLQLRMAAQRGRIEALVQLLDRGADPEASDFSQFTVLMHSALSDTSKCTIELLARGADMERRDADGHTALYHALAGGAPGVAAELILRGATIEAHVVAGMSADIHGLWDNVLSIQLLRFVRENTNVYKKIKSRRTALETLPERSRNLPPRPPARERRQKQKLSALKALAITTEIDGTVVEHPPDQVRENVVEDALKDWKEISLTRKKKKKKKKETMREQELQNLPPLAPPDKDPGGTEKEAENSTDFWSSLSQAESLIADFEAGTLKVVNYLEATATVKLHRGNTSHCSRVALPPSPRDNIIRFEP